MTIGNIADGESLSSVRGKLNETIDAVNGLVDLPTGQVGYWSPSADTAGNGTTTLTDLEGSNDGTLTSMDAATDWVDDFGAGGSVALDFDGVDDYVDFGDVHNFGSGSFTVSVWFNASDTLATSTSRIIQKRGTGGWGTTPGWCVILNRSGTDVNVADAGLDDASTTARVEDVIIGSVEEWIHLVMVVDRANGFVHLYANGQHKKSKAIPGGFGSIDNTRKLTIGASDVSLTQFFKGQVDSTRLYNAAISYSGTRKLWEAGRV